MDEKATNETPQEDRYVPQAALEDERHKRQRLETELAELRGTVKALADRPKDQPREKERTLSAAELRNAVAEGQMTEDEADRIRERQMTARIRDQVTEELKSEMTGQRLVDRVSEGLKAYKDAIPSLSDHNSREFAKVKAEFDHLVSIGYDASDPRTELAAARAAFGDPSRIRKIEAEPPESHQETGGGSSATDGRTNDGAPKGLTPRLRTWYRDCIDKGRYSGWDDPKLKKELEFVNPGVAKRAQERAA